MLLMLPVVVSTMSEGGGVNDSGHNNHIGDDTAGVAEVGSMSCALAI